MSRPIATGFSSVLRFEVARTLRRPQFWLAAILTPVLFAIIAAAVAWSSSATQSTSATSEISFEYLAPAGLISPSVAADLHGKEITDQAAAIDRVRDGSLDALFVYGGTSPTVKVDVYAQDKGIFSNGSYSNLAGRVFDASVDAAVDSPALVQKIRHGVSADIHAYSHGQPAPGLGGVIPPAFLMLVLVLAIGLLGNQMLNTTVEEKENRISEMLLVSITARTLIQAKIVALAVVGLVQVCVIAIPSLALLAFSGGGDTFDGFALGPLQFELVQMTIGVVVLIGGLFLITSALVTIGAIMPSAKDAAPFFTVVALATVAPFYLVTSIAIEPQNPVATTMTFIPPFAAATALTRNAVDGLPLWEAAIVVVELFLFGALLLRFAMAVFQRGVIQYGSRLSLFKTPSTRARTAA